MNIAANQTFRISWRSGISIFLAIALILLLILTWPRGWVFLVPMLGLSLVTLVMPAVTIRSDGLSLYGVNHLQWGEVRSAERTTILGLSYIVVHRQRGMRWWIPLYVDDKQGLLAALASRAPSGSALHSLAAAAFNKEGSENKFD